jgi:hypothetical protein|tara:strand:+ start:1265 stop:1744 length:480 start_codon:yes stop_codon:yes gene_type:complete
LFNLTNRHLLKWWIQTVAIAFASVFAWEIGWVEALWYADMTKISFVILSLFAITTATTGFISYKEGKTKLSNYIWFGSEAMITLGMIGTVAGFLLMLNSAFADLNVQDVQNMQSAIADMAVGMSTALSTTLVGLVCSVLTKAQMVILENSWDADDAKQT